MSVGVAAGLLQLVSSNVRAIARVVPASSGLPLFFMLPVIGVLVSLVRLYLKPGGSRHIHPLRFSQTTCPTGEALPGLVPQRRLLETQYLGKIHPGYLADFIVVSQRPSVLARARRV